MAMVINCEEAWDMVSEEENYVLADDNQSSTSSENSDSHNSKKFELQIVYDQFRKSIHGVRDDDVKLDNYLLAYKEIYKFFHLMGSIFSFVSSDVKSKMDVLDEYRNKKDVGHHFETFKTMIEYERNELLLETDDYVSGSRTLLRLHRGLDFIQVFLKELGLLKGSDNTSTVCRSAYNITLAQFHPWLIKKGANMAMYALPKRDVLLDKVCGSHVEAQKALDTLPQTLAMMDEIYNRTENLYTVYKLHSLP